MPSVLGLLEAKESAAREAVERAREEAARIAAVLEEAERVLERLVIAREAVVEVLAEPGGRAVDVVKEAVVAAAVTGSPVPRQSGQLARAVLAPEYQRVISVLETEAAAGRDKVRARELAAALGLEAVPAKIEGVRSRAKRLAERGWIARHQSGEFSILTV
ncbi:hypothetical protein [Streptomyces lunaelactis]|uniref:hypothetical protein n=1 Tax=Streptomyces lunaelactis TaxID=1535768 RepID=UPI00131EF801|nr:hypothetical protein [Streptomyces lunaelactis]NUK22773.1 hypothetical protein [Streptomyces lunaelactis]NUK85020.1 hypothetical protein [Streptomyces lunaelactis]